MENRLNAADKNHIRKVLREKRRGLADSQRTSAANGLLTQLLALPGFCSAHSLALYLVNDGEIDPAEVMKWCWKNDRKPFVPIVAQSGDHTLRFAEITEHTEFLVNRFGIREPIADSESLLDARDLDLVLMPLVAFDAAGNRVGMGGGFYDRTFEFLLTEKPHRPKLIGIAYEIQKVEKIEVESWDIPLSMVVTESSTYIFD